MILKKSRNVLKSLNIRNKYYFKWANGDTIEETPIIPPLPIQNIVFLFPYVILIEIFFFFKKRGIIVISPCKTLTSCISEDRLNKLNIKDFAQQLFLILITCQRKTSKGKGWGLLCRITQVSQPMEPPTSRSNITSDHGQEERRTKELWKSCSLSPPTGDPDNFPASVLDLLKCKATRKYSVSLVLGTRL